ncbi:ATP-binding cassette domain-containing protein [Oerskovia sp. M15]
MVGGNGSGKTTLCKSFNGLVPTSGRGPDRLGARPRPGHRGRRRRRALARRRVRVPGLRQPARAPHGPRRRLVRPVNFGLPDWAERTASALETLDITSLADRFTWQLSGGQQHLTAIAGAIALTPSVLVVDEPVAEVDPTARRRSTSTSPGSTASSASRSSSSSTMPSSSPATPGRWSSWPTGSPLAPARGGGPGPDRGPRGSEHPGPQVTAVARAFEAHGPVPSTVPVAIEWLRDRRLAEPARLGPTLRARSPTRALPPCPSRATARSSPASTRSPAPTARSPGPGPP